MPENRYFTDEDLKNKRTIFLDKDEFFHLNKVMRNKEGDPVEIINGKGFLAKGKVIKINKSNCEIELETLNVFKKKNSLCLIQPFLKPKNIELVLEKATELGASEFIFYNSKTSEKQHISDSRSDRWKKIIVSAIKQCSSLFLPEIKIYKDFKSIHNIMGNIYLASFDKDSKNLIDIDIDKNRNSYIFVGPEKGFLQEEEQEIIKTFKAKKVSLNKNVLRAETASIISVGVISQKT